MTGNDWAFFALRLQEWAPVIVAVFAVIVVGLLIFLRGDGTD